MSDLLIPTLILYFYKICGSNRTVAIQDSNTQFSNNSQMMQFSSFNDLLLFFLIFPWLTIRLFTIESIESNSFSQLSVLMIICRSKTSCQSIVTNFWSIAISQNLQVASYQLILVTRAQLTVFLVTMIFDKNDWWCSVFTHVTTSLKTKEWRIFCVYS